MTTLQNRRTVFGLNNPEVMSNAAPASEAGIEKSEGQDGFFIYSKKAYSLWFKDQAGSWNLYESYDLSEIADGNAFSWNTNTAAFIQTQEVNHRVSVFIIENKEASTFQNREKRGLSVAGAKRLDSHSNYKRVRMQNSGHTGEAYAIAIFDENGEAAYVSAPPSGQREGKILGWDENGNLGWIAAASQTVDIMGETEGIENEATINGGAYFSNTGAAVLDGASHLEADSNVHYADQFQASAAIKPTSIGNAFQTIMGTRGDGGANGFLVQVNNSTVRAVGPQADHFVLDAALPAGIDLNDGEYHDIQVKWVKDTELSIFVDGQKIGTHTPTGAVTPGVHNMEIGRNPKNQASYFTGEIDGVKVNNAVKTDQEIADEYMAKVLGNDPSPADYSGIEDLQTTTMQNGASLEGTGFLAVNGNNYAQADSNHHYGDYLTATAWFRTIEHESAYGVLFSSRNGSGNGFALAIKNSGAHAHHPQTNNTHLEPTFDHVELSDGNWHQAVLRWKADEDLSVFIDGVKVDSLVPAGDINGGVGDLLIGTEPHGFTGMFIGHIDGVKVENVYKSDAEIMSGFTGNPIITLLGDNPLIVPFGNQAADPGASAVDHPDGDLTAQITSDWDSVIGADPVGGNHVVTYSVTDSDGNQNTVTREVAIHGLIQPDLYFDGSSLDAIVGDNSLVLAVDTSIDSSNGKYGDNSYSYGPTGDKFPITFENSVDTTSGTYTFSMWFYNARDTSEYRAVLRQIATGMPVNTRRLPIVIGPNNELGHQLMGTLTWTGYDMTPKIGLQSWTHLAVVADGVNSKYYIDGVFVGTAAGVIQTAITELGSYGGGGGDATFAEGLDEIAYWPRALSDDEIYTIGTTNLPLLEIDTLLTAPIPPVVVPIPDLYFDGSSTESQIGNNTLSFSGTAALTTSNGKYDSASFDFGTSGSGYKTLANDIDLSSGVYTFSLWFYNMRSLNDFMAVIKKSAGGVGGAYYPIVLSNAADKKIGILNGPLALTNYSMAHFVGDTSWNHLAVVANGTTSTYYVNGQNVGSVNVVVTETVGRFNGYSLRNQTFAEAMDEIAYWGSALSAEQVEKIYNSSTKLSLLSGYDILSPELYFDGSSTDAQIGSNSVSFAGAGALSTSKGMYGATSFGFGTSGNNYMNLTNDISLATGVYTFSLWFYNKRSNNNHATILKTSTLGLEGARYAMMTYGASDELGVFDVENGATQFFGSGYNLSDGGSEWTHLAVVADGTNSTFYVNGQQVGNQVNRVIVDNVGRINGYPTQDQSFAEAIDEVAYWGSALNAAQIEKIYNSSTKLSILTGDETLPTISANLPPIPTMYFNGSSQESQNGDYFLTPTNISSFLSTSNGKYGNTSFFYDVTGQNKAARFSPAIELPTEYTLSFWFYNMRPGTGGHRNIISTAATAEGNSNGHVAYVHQGTGALRQYIGGFIDTSYNLVNAGLAADTWHNMVIVAKDGGTTFYINGEKVGNKTNAVASSVFLKDLGGIVGNNYTFAEAIDEVAYWPEALGLLQINNIHKSTLPLSDLTSWQEYFPPLPDATTTNLEESYIDSNGTEQPVKQHGTSLSLVDGVFVDQHKADYVYGDFSDDLRPIDATELFSFSAFYKFTDSANGTFHLFSTRSGQGWSISLQKINDTTARIYVGYNGSGVYLDTGNTVTTSMNEFHHVAMTSDNGTMKLYHDGVEIYSNSNKPFAPGIPGNAIYTIASGISVIKGEVDQVNTYKGKVLTVDEIELLKTYSANYTAPPADPNAIADIQTFGNTSISNDIITLNGEGNYAIYTGDFRYLDQHSISFWFKTETNGTMAILSSHVSGHYLGGYNGFWFRMVNGALRTRTLDINASEHVVGSGLNDGQWHHVALTYQAQTVGGRKLYLDGVQTVNANSGVSNFIADEFPLFIGANPHDNVPRFWPYTGDFYGLQITNTVMTAQEVADEYVNNHPAGDGLEEQAVMQNGATLVDGELVLDGVNQYATLADDDAYDRLDGEDVTIHMWVYASSFSANNRMTLIRKGVTGDGGNWDGYIIELRDTSHTNIAAGDMGIKIYSSDYNSGIETNNTIFRPAGGISLNEWHHIAVTMKDSNDQVEVYFNGQSLGTWIASQGLSHGNDYELKLGGDGVSGRSLDGKMKKVTIEKSILTTEQIAALYAADATVSTPKFYLDGSSATTTIGDASDVVNLGSAVVVNNGKYGSNSFSFGTSGGKAPIRLNNLDLSTGVYSVSLWFYNKRGGNDFGSILRQGGTGSNSAYYPAGTHQTTNELGLHLGAASNTSPDYGFRSSGYDMTSFEGLQEWSHLAVVADGTNTTFYINGQQVGNVVPHVVTTYLREVGAYDGADSQVFAEGLDEIAYWDSVLTEAQIQIIYNSSVKLGDIV